MEEKEKIVAKEEAESLMIFLITAARGKREKKSRQKKRERGTGRHGGVEGSEGGGGGRGSGSSGSGGTSKETAPPCRVNPVFIRTGSPFHPYSTSFSSSSSSS